MKLRIAGAQIPVTGSMKDNCMAILRAVNFAIEEKADILLTPEGSLSGYTGAFDQNMLNGMLKTVVTRASEGKLGLALGTCWYDEGDPNCYNQIRFYDGDGVYLGSHCKILLCKSLVPDEIRGIDEPFRSKPLDTFQFKGVTIGALICNDLWANPGCTPMPDLHLTQRLSELGAKIVFHAVNGGRSPDEFSQVVAWQYHESNLRMRARAGRLWIVTADNCHPEDQQCSAPSGVVNPDGNWICKAPSLGERYFAHTVEL